VDTETKLEVFIAKVSEWMDTTVQYRKDLCAKQDRLLAKQESFDIKLNDLPCKERKGIYDSVNKQLGIIWIVISCVIVAVFAEWIKGR
jgi:hypothetical protein